MKNKAVFLLVKDIMLAAMAAGIGFALGQDTTIEPGFLAFLCAGIPFGWRVASKIITACSLKGIGLKLLISMVLGLPALFIVPVVGVVRVVLTLRKPRKRRPGAGSRACKTARAIV